MSTSKLLTPADVAERLQVETATVQGWLRDRKLRGAKLGRYWRVRPEDLNAFIMQHMTPADVAEAVMSAWEDGRRQDDDEGGAR